MTTSESKKPIFWQNESIRIDSYNELNWKSLVTGLCWRQNVRYLTPTYIGTPACPPGHPKDCLIARELD